ncbi:hypothetical protein, partial [Alcanivorax sp. HI0033]|uniref:hypothetical protein n=1 Tax=Alcanivorax sp. HI0033 TaxID=1822228 RepID=UPI001E389836
HGLVKAVESSKFKVETRAKLVATRFASTPRRKTRRMHRSNEAPRLDLAFNLFPVMYGRGGSAARLALNERRVSTLNFELSTQST